MAGNISDIVVRGVPYDLQDERVADLTKDVTDLVYRMQGKDRDAQGNSIPHDNTLDPFYYKQFSGGEQAYLDAKEWLNSLHTTEGGAVPLGLLRLYINGAFVYVLQNVISYAGDQYTQTILNGYVMSNGGILTGVGIYTRSSQRVNGVTTWTEWQRIGELDSATVQSMINASISTKADLVDGKVPANQLPAYVDDILEYTSISEFPATGDDAHIYLALDTNKQYRWSGTQYSEVSPSLALGETAQTAFAGNRGKALENAQSALASDIEDLEDDIETLSGAVNGKASASDLTNLANHVSAAEGDIDALQDAISALPTKSGDNTFSGNNTFGGKTTLGNVTADKISTDGSITLTNGDNTTKITPSSVESPIMQKTVNGVGKDLATVEEMDTALAGKASTTALSAEKTRAETVEQALSQAVGDKATTIELTRYLTEGSVLPWTGLYVYSGRPISHLRVIQDGATSWTLIFCIQHMDASEESGFEFHTFGNSTTGWEYMDSYDDTDVPEWVLRAFGENIASTQFSGKMSATDKSHVDTLWQERGQGGGGSDTFATLFSELTSNGGIIRMGDNYMNFDSTNSVYWGALKALLLNTSTEGQEADIQNNHYTNIDTNYTSNEVFSNDENFTLSEAQIGQNEYAFVCQGGDIVITSGHELYAVKLMLRNPEGTGSVTLTVADEDNTQSTTVTLPNNSNTFVECVLDYGNTPLASSKKIIIEKVNGTDLNVMLQPTIKFVGG